MEKRNQPNPLIKGTMMKRRKVKKDLLDQFLKTVFLGIRLESIHQTIDQPRKNLPHQKLSKPMKGREVELQEIIMDLQRSHPKRIWQLKQAIIRN